ncbi:NAD(P)H-dependent oxidoreductase [Salisediminibacterium beveridgei]|uniref:Putative NAD(P)H oxidoreductase n=1 Tax=Salisediminibacterium beveridgei TaxID=632773 RepID=A0A1D7QWN9_9BACI|nr:NAD(P)H-dependent oxidoreductase [Salisediminibacterium beveridgei]AOM83437.1 putative NAD(P)H oxidoreductase [Salisediminibacterium beveridgei]
MNEKLIISMHPTRDSFNGAICETLRDTFTKQGITATLRDVSTLAFDPLLTIEDYERTVKGIYTPFMKTEHAYWDRAEEIILVFPLWWGHFPALGKGYMDHVLSYGFAYELEGEEPVPKALKDKHVSIIFTSGSPENEMRENGLYHDLIDSIDQSIVQFCGMTLNQVLHFGDVLQASDEQRREMLRRVDTSFQKEE